MKKDFSFLLPAERTSDDLIKVIKASDKLIGNITIFDVYNEQKEETTLVSLGLEVEINQIDKVLNAEQIGLIMDKIIRDVKEQLGAILRS